MMFEFGCSGRSAAVVTLVVPYRIASTRKTARKRCETNETTTAGPIRFCCCSKRKGISTGWEPSTWTERCPADSLARTSGVVVSAIGNVMGLVEVLSRTGLTGCNCKRSASHLVHVYRTRPGRGTALSSDAAGPGANRGIAATVREHHRQRIRGPRLAVAPDQEAAPGPQR